MRIFGFAPRQLAALTLPFLVYHLLVFTMITGIVPRFWETFPILLTLTRRPKTGSSLVSIRDFTRSAAASVSEIICGVLFVIGFSFLI